MGWFKFLTWLQSTTIIQRSESIFMMMQGELKLIMWSFRVNTKRRSEKNVYKYIDKLEVRQLSNSSLLDKLDCNLFNHGCNWYCR